MATRRKIDFSFTKQLLNDYLMTERQRKQNEAIQAREAELQKGQQTNAMLMEILKNPELAARLSRGGVNQVGGMNIAGFGPTPTDQLQVGYDLVNNAHSLSDLPTEEGIRGRLGNATTDVAPVIAALIAKRNSLTHEAPVSLVNQYNPETGASEMVGIPTRDLPSRGPIQTGPTPQQAGQNKLTTELAGDLSPEMTLAKTQAQNEIEAGTRREKVRTAGATAGAEAGARASVENDPKNQAARIWEYAQKAQIEAATVGNREAAKAADDAARSATTANIALSQIKEKYDAAKLGRGGASTGDKVTAVGRSLIQTMGGPGQAVMQGINPQAAELDRLAGGYAMLLYRAYGGTGANVSDKDIQFMMGAIPTSSVLAEVGDEVFANSAMLLTFAPMISARYGNIPFEQRYKIGQEWTKQYKAAQAAGATQFEDPASPGKFVPVRPR